MTGRKLFSVLTMAATVYERENVRRYSQSSDTLSLLFDFFKIIIFTYSTQEEGVLPFMALPVVQ